MNRTLSVVAFLVAAAHANAQIQAPQGTPVVLPKITELGMVRDSSVTGRFLPIEAPLSPNGRFVAYTTLQDLRIWNSATRTSTVLLEGNVFGLAWSPQGSVLAFARQQDGGGQSNIWALRIDTASGRATATAQRVSLSASIGQAPVFSPDGRSIVFGRVDANNAVSIVVVPSLGGAEKVIVPDVRPRWLRWSDDGSRIFYFASTPGASRQLFLYSVASSGGTPLRMHEFSGEYDIPGIAREPHAITVHQPPTTEGRSTLVTTLSGKPVALATIPLDVRIFDMSGLLRQAGIVETHPRSLRVLNTTDGSSRELVDTSSEVIAASFYASADRIAVLALEKRKPVIFLMKADGSDRRRIELKARPHYTSQLQGSTSISVSPDGERAVYLGAGNRTLELVEFADGTQRTLVTAAQLVTPHWLDSRSVRYIRIDGSPITDTNRGVWDLQLAGAQKQLRVLPAAQYGSVRLLDAATLVTWGQSGHKLVSLSSGREAVTFASAVQGAGALSADNSMLALRPAARSGESSAERVVLVPVNGGSNREIRLPFSDLGPMIFDSGIRNIYMRGRDLEEGPMTFYSVPLDGGQPRVIARVNTRERQGIFSASPDARFILYSVAAPKTATFLSLDFTELIPMIRGAGSE